MAKKKSLNLGTILVGVGFILGIIALICLAGAGLKSTATVGKITTTVTFGLAGFLAGKHHVTTTVTGLGDAVTKTVDVDGGLSYFAIIALVLTILGIVATVVGIILKKKILVLVGGILLILSGISMFLLKVAGSEYNGVAFTDAFKGTDEVPFNLGVGTILYGIFAILGGSLTTAGAFLRK